MDEVASLTSSLDALCRTAEQNFRLQPRDTRKALGAETKQIFDRYAHHGTQARLRHNVQVFLETGDEGLRFLAVPVGSSVEGLQKQKQKQDGKAKAKGKAREPIGGDGPRMNDEECAPLVTSEVQGGLPFHLDRTFTLGADVLIPDGLLESMDRVFGLYALEAKELLRHHC